MQQEAGLALHLVSVVGLLKEARDYLGSEVSETAIAEAESLPSGRRVDAFISDDADKDHHRPPERDQKRFLSAFRGLLAAIETGQATKNLRRVVNHTDKRAGFTDSGSQPQVAPTCRSVMRLTMMARSRELRCEALELSPPAR